MCEINLQRLTQLVAESQYLNVESFGVDGACALRVLLDGVRRIYKFVDPEQCGTSFVVFKAIDDAAELLPKGRSIELKTGGDFAQRIGRDCIVQVRENGAFLLWTGIAADPTSLSTNAVVYQLANSSERIIAKSKVNEIPKLVSSYVSMFAIPAYSDLRSALDHYRTRMVRRSSCQLLKDVWVDENRLFIRDDKPESVMRKSLTQHLKSTLRGDVEVRPEQVVDESHPVDIKVTFLFANRLALIEIKWLGNSIKADRSGFTAEHRDARAKSGAKQLAEYLDANAIQAPENISRGFLVVIDARRQGLDLQTKIINKAKGLYFADKEIAYDPDYHVTREDFESPMRMFVEPVCH
jgi:hypothetical protein